MLTMRFDEARSGFFDRQRVVRAMDAASRQQLSRFGAFVRTRARSSIRQRKRISNPGEPPSSHVGTLRALIFFAYDQGRKSVVIGPTQSGRGVAPEVLEYGGTETDLRGRRASYRARPFMGPAFQAELKQAPELWRNSVR